MNSADLFGSWGFIEPTHSCENIDRDVYHFLPDGFYIHECCVFPPRQSVERPKSYTLKDTILILTRGIGSSELTISQETNDTLRMIDARGTIWRMRRLDVPKAFMRRFADSKGNLIDLDTAEQGAAANPYSRHADFLPTIGLHPHFFQSLVTGSG